MPCQVRYDASSLLWFHVNFLCCGPLSDPGNTLAAAAGNNMKVLHPPGGFMHLAAAAAQSAGGVPHSHMSSAQLTFGAMPMPVKPSSDQKPAAGT
jgi:hypothetical protein